MKTKYKYQMGEKVTVFDKEQLIKLSEKYLSTIFQAGYIEEIAGKSGAITMRHISQVLGIRREIYYIKDLILNVYGFEIFSSLKEKIDLL